MPFLNLFIKEKDRESAKNAQICRFHPNPFPQSPTSSCTCHQIIPKDLKLSMSPDTVISLTNPVPVLCTSVRTISTDSNSRKEVLQIQLQLCFPAV